jgi:hypothetical protein
MGLVAVQGALGKERRDEGTVGAVVVFAVITLQALDFIL